MIKWLANWEGRISTQVFESAQRNELKERAADYVLNEALRESEIGNSTDAQEQAFTALTLASDPDTQAIAALALAVAGETHRARTLADGVNKLSPLNALLSGYWLPTIRASIDINDNRGQNAVEILRSASAYELGRREIVRRDLRVL